MHPARSLLALSIVLLHTPFLPLTSASPSPSDPITDSAISKLTYEVHTKGDLVCRPFGECEACPSDEIHQPFCHPHGNRRLMHCIPRAHSSPLDPYDEEGTSWVAGHKDHSAGQGKVKRGLAESQGLVTRAWEKVVGQRRSGGEEVWFVGNSTRVWEEAEIAKREEELGKGRVGELPAWESCGKVVSKETSDYWQFVTTNTLLLALSLVILLLRANKLAAIQYRQLVARIGSIGGGGSGGGGVAAVVGGGAKA